MPGPSATRPRNAAIPLCALMLGLLAVTAEPEPTAEPAPPAEPSILRIGAASSLRDAVGDFTSTIFAETHPEVKVEIAFGASSSLAAQIRAGAPLDLFLSADEEIANGLAKEGLTAPPITFAGNRLVVIASRDFGAEISSALDLLRPEVRRIAIPDDAVPMGRYARSWLREQGALEPLESRIVRTEHARATLATVDQGNADVAIVFHSDVRHAKSSRVAYEIPAFQQPRIAYAGAVVRGSPGEKIAEVALQQLGELRASALFIRDGFSLPPGPAP